MNTSGSRVAVGSNENDGVTRIYEYDDNNMDWVLMGSEILGNIGSDIGSTLLEEFSGISVCIMNESGNCVVIGASIMIVMEQVGALRGKVRVYELDSGSWIQIGSTICINNAGTKIIIGAPEPDFGPGFVRTYELINSEWIKLGSDRAILMINYLAHQ